MEYVRAKGEWAFQADTVCQKNKETMNEPVFLRELNWMWLDSRLHLGSVKMSLGYHSKDPNVSPHLNYITRYACLQELFERDFQLQRPRCWAQKPRRQRGIVCTKGHMQKGQVPLRNNYACLKEFNHSTPHPISTEGSFPVEEKMSLEHELTLLQSLIKP